MKSNSESTTMSPLAWSTAAIGTMVSPGKMVVTVPSVSKTGSSARLSLCEVDGTHQTNRQESGDCMKYKLFHCSFLLSYFDFCKPPKI